jgi:arsenate reductase
MKILFLCVANSARSQIAEGLARSILGKSVHVESAGSAPSGKVNPIAIEVLKEAGVDISTHYSKSWDDLPSSFFNDLDYVVTLCAEEVCPTLATKAKKLHWGMPDPKTSDDFRKVRDELTRRLKEFKF